MIFIKACIVMILLMVAIITGQDNGLIHQYKFDGDLKDAVGDQHGKVLKGASETAVFVEGHDGTAKGAIEFFGLDGAWYCIEVGTWDPAALGTKDEMTVTFWGKWKGPVGGPPKYKPQDIINKRDNYKANQMMWGINQHGFQGHILSVHRPGVKANSTAAMPQNKWAHVAVSMDGKQVYFYLDGKPIDAQNYTYGTGVNAMIRIGNSANGGRANVDDNYNGVMDDVRFYSRKLTDEEIANIHKPATAISKAGTKKTRLKVIQNTTGNSIYIKNLAGKATVIVVDLKGKLIVKKEANSSITIARDMLSPGINIVKILNTTANIEEMKIIK